MDVSFTDEGVSKYCLGMDPIFSIFVPKNDFLVKEKERLGDIVAVTERGCLALLDAAQNSGQINRVKFQSAYFERLGARGFGLMFDLCKTASSRGFKVLVDAKRGDISSTMEAYGGSFLEKSYIDALTVTPYMGLDVLTPLLDWFDQGKLVYVVLSSSNPSGFDFQSQKLNDERTVAEYLFDEITGQFSSRLANLGFVVGATIFHKLSRSFQKKLMDVNLLMPGFGAQGAEMNDSLKSLFQNGSGDVAIPVSRGFSMFGMTEHEPQLNRLSTWEEYSELVEAQISKTLSC